MKSTKVILIGSISIFILLVLLSYLIGVRPIPLLWALFVPALIAGIHIVAAQALYVGAKAREEQGEEIFLKLDPLFWGMTGLAFGILGLLAFRLLNDHFIIDRKAKSIDRSQEIR